MALLDLAQDVVDELGLPAVTSVIGSTDNTVRQIYALLVNEGKELRSKQQWPQLTREGTITLVEAQDSYPFPADFDRQIFQTQWDQSNFWELRGPLSPQEWNLEEHGSVAVGPRRGFRVKGFGTNQFFLDRSPSAAEAGQIISFEYQTTTWVVPTVWVTATSYAAGSYVFYDGNVYSTVLGGTTGATPPTHTTGSTSDGGVLWAYRSAGYEKPLADSDTFLLDQQVLKLGVKWRFMQAKGMQWQLMKAEAEAAAGRDDSSLSGAPVLVMHRPRRSILMDESAIPDRDYGL